VDIIDAGAYLVGVCVTGEGVEQFHLRARGLDRDDVGVHRTDRADDVIEFRIAHVGVDLGVLADAGGGDTEAFDRPVQIILPFRAAQRQAFAQCRFVDLDDRGAGGLEVRTSSRMASAIWRQLAARDWSSRTKDQLRIVTGPVSMPFMGRSVCSWA
jgi:hypothetical protein